MRTLCDVCESAAAIIFCAADEAALCRACDEKVLLFILSLFFASIIIESDSFFYIPVFVY